MNKSIVKQRLIQNQNILHKSTGAKFYYHTIFLATLGTDKAPIETLLETE